MKLYRPTGEKEKQLIEESGWKRFPPRLSGQPFFYPVLSKEHAIEIARDWNAMDEQSEFTGYVFEFDVDDEFIKKYDIQTVGASYHQELWVPSDELEEFNDHIIGTIDFKRLYMGYDKREYPI